MNILRQFLILFLISFISEIISSLAPFVIPSSLIGMIILFLLLLSNIIDIKNIKTVGDFLQQNIAIFFVPASISLIDEIDFIKNNFFVLFAISFISFVVAFLVTAYSAMFVAKIQERFFGVKNE